jgi:DNA-binding beta-propeller fold protein YncE
MAFKTKENIGYVVSAASNIVVKIAVDPNTGAITVQQAQDKRVADINVGRNPRGIVINGADTRAYVMNYVSRDVTVIDLTRFPEQVTGTGSAPFMALPRNWCWSKELYNTGVGEREQRRQYVRRRRQEACGSCHLRPVG